MMWFYIALLLGSCATAESIDEYPCSFEILSVDHADGAYGQYFNFDVASVDCILGTSWETNDVFNVFYSGTNSIRQVVIWDTPNGGSTGDGHGRLDTSSSGGDWSAGGCIAFQTDDVSCDCADETFLCHNNFCQNITTFTWGNLVEDGIEKPTTVANMSINESTLTLNIDIEVEYLGYTAADDDGYVYGTTYIIDFEDFDAHSANIREPGTCENRETSDTLTNAAWDDLWSYSTTPSLAGHVGSTSFLAYPPGGVWSVEMSSDDQCGAVQYTTSLSWNDLVSCTNHDGSLGNYIDIVDNGDSIQLSGTLYINVVSPYYYENGDVGAYYRVYQLLSQPFQIVVSKSIYVVDSIGINLLQMDVIAVYKEENENTFSLIVLTESAEYLQLSRNGLDEDYVETFIADASNTAGLTSSDFRTLTAAETENEGCLTNKDYICSQLWKITADNAACSADSKYTDFTGLYNVQFDAVCRSESDLNNANLTIYCDDWLSLHKDEITDSTGKVLLSAKLTWKDEICDPLIFEVQFAAEMQFFIDSGYLSQVTDEYLYAVGESRVYVRIISDYPEDALTVFDATLLNVWLCTFDPLTPPSLDIDPGAGDGGCFEDNKDESKFIGHIYDAENDVKKEGFRLNGSDSNVVQFQFDIPSKVVRDTLYVHAQVEVSLSETGSVRRLIHTDNMKKANQINHFVHAVGVSSSPNNINDNPNHYYPNSLPLTPPQQTFVLSLQSPWVIAIGVLFALVLTLNVAFMCYKCCIQDDGSRFSGRYSVVKPADSEYSGYSEGSEWDVINVLSDVSN